MPRTARHWKDSRLDFLSRSPALRVLVLGAGRAGDALVRDLVRENRYRPVGILDDNAQIRGARIHGVPVLGTLEQLPELARETAAQMLLIAMPSATSAQMQRVVGFCEATAPFRTMPRLADVVAGRSLFGELGGRHRGPAREPPATDWTAIRTGLAGKRVLSPAAAVRSVQPAAVARLGAASLTILEVSEYNLYRIEQELRGEFPDLLLAPRLGDCGDGPGCEHVFAEARPQIVFHAAAYKHVPLLQEQLREAFRNNVLGTRVVAELADRHGVECFVLISADRAVNPSSIMGACKRAAEIYCRTRRAIARASSPCVSAACSIRPARHAAVHEQIRKGAR